MEGDVGGMSQTKWRSRRICNGRGGGSGSSDGCDASSKNKNEKNETLGEGYAEYSTKTPSGRQSAEMGRFGGGDDKNGR